MRHQDGLDMAVALTPEEGDFVAAMMAETGIASPSDLLRLALWHLAKHLDVPVGNQIFAVRGTRPRRQAQA